MRSSTILIVNLKSLAAETIKNVALAGIGRLIVSRLRCFELEKERKELDVELTSLLDSLRLPILRSWTPKSSPQRIWELASCSERETVSLVKRFVWFPPLLFRLDPSVELTLPSFHPLPAFPRFVRRCFSEFSPPSLKYNL